MLIDGGKGQLNAAREVMRELGVADVPAVGLAEGTGRGSAGRSAPGSDRSPLGDGARDRDGGRTYDRVFVEGRADPAPLPWASPGLKLLQRIRDEAHRYASTYHRHLRDQRTARSVLDEIPGIGPRRKRELLRRFGSVAGIRRASAEELAAVPGISRALAERILDYVRT